MTAARPNACARPIIIACRPTSGQVLAELGLGKPHLMPNQIGGLLDKSENNSPIERSMR